MTPDEMIDHAFDLLEGPERERAEAEIEADVLLADRVDRLDRAVRNLVDDGPHVPRPGLAGRTIAAVAAAEKRRGRWGEGELIHVGVPFRWADLAVAAGIFVAALLTVFPAVRRSRDSMAQAGCVFNLQQIGLGLAQYGGRFGSYPDAPPECPVSHGGIYAMMLKETGLLPDESVLQCPCGGTAPPGPVPNYATGCELKRRDPAGFVRLIHWDFAYQVPRPTNRNQLAARFAVLADKPSYDRDGQILSGNSPNHNKRGQNVLHADNSVGFYHTRMIVPNDDMYLNADHRPVTGRNPGDSVLLLSHFPLHGG